MGSVSLTGNDTLTLNNRVFHDFGEGKVGELTFPNDIVEVRVGKNGNSLYAEKASGRQADLKLKLLRGSSDDRYLNGLLSLQQQSFQNTVLNFGQFVKNIGDGTGNVAFDTYILGGGVIQKPVHAETDTEGDVLQSEVEWMLKFTSAARVIT